MKTTPGAKWGMHTDREVGWTVLPTNLQASPEHGIDLRSHDPERSYNQSYVNS